MAAKSPKPKKLVYKTLFVIALLLILLMAVAYIYSLFQSSSGSFTVRTLGTVQGQLSLSETEGFSNPQSVLSGPSLDKMDNISYSWIDLESIGQKDGAANGENYLVYTYYVRNNSEAELSYRMSLVYDTATKGVDSAVRIAVFKNGECTIYALQAENGQPESYPEGVVSFLNSGTVASEDQSLAAGGIDKYTVLIWLEGEDPECVDAVRGGYMQLEMRFSELGSGAEAE